MMRWGFCIPKECSNIDLERAIQEKLEARASVRPSMCQKNTTKEVSAGTYITLAIFGIIGLNMTISTFLYSFGYRIYNFGECIYCENYIIKVCCYIFIS